MSRPPKHPARLRAAAAAGMEPRFVTCEAVKEILEGPMGELTGRPSKLQRAMLYRVQNRGVPGGRAHTPPNAPPPAPWFGPAEP